MSRPRPFQDNPLVGSRRVGATVGEFQLYKSDYDNLLRPMVRDCDVRIVCIGSCDKHGVLGHPFTFEERKAMIAAVHGPVFKFVQLHDIDADLTEDWVHYVLQQIRAAGQPDPTDFYVGSESDAGWYRSAFPDAPTWLTPAEDASGEGQRRRLHVMGRTSAMVSARDLRTLVEQRDPRWREHVPARLWHYVEQTYPPRIRTAVRAPVAPPAGIYPVGTRLRLDGENELLELKADEKWRPLARRDEKADYARSRRSSGE